MRLRAARVEPRGERLGKAPIQPLPQCIRYSHYRIDATTERLTYRQLQERRALINKRMRERAGR